MNKILLIIGFIVNCFTLSSQIVINEIMTTNATTNIETDFYNFPDWIELYNNGTTSVNLSEYYLTDESGNMSKWRLPSYTLNAGSYYIVYCDKEETGNHSNFGLSADGETIYLSHNSGTVLDEVKYGKQFSDVSYGRNPDNTGGWHYCATPTPGKSNKITNAVQQGGIATYSVPAGRINNSLSLLLKGENIKYTIDGSEPTAVSTGYTKAIAVNKTSTVKTKTFQDGYLPGKTYANTYFYNEHNFTLPIISLSFTPDYFYDNTIGIHVVGTNGTTGKCNSVANWNQNWERTAYFEYFDVNGNKRISQQIGVKLAGGCTRGRDQKSLSLYARDKYDNNDFDYPFFVQKPEIISYKSMVLRNSGNDQDQTLLRDAFTQALVNNSIDLDYLSYQPTIVYFNGEYRGIMNLREKADEDYFLSNYGIHSDEIDFLEYSLQSEIYVLRGSAYDYNNMLTFMKDHDMSNDSIYNIISSQIDIQEYINYMAVELYIGNADWPQNNIKFWKKKENGKWRWIMFDLDYGFGFRKTAPDEASFDKIFSDNKDRPWSTQLFQYLMQNEGFKAQFLNTFNTLMNTAFQPQWFEYVMDSLSSIIDFEITYNQEKYGRTKAQWTGYLNTLRQQSTDRLSFMQNYFKSYFNLNSNDEVNISLAKPDNNSGKIKINNSIIQSYPFSMNTYKNMKLEINALPEKGFKFSHWVAKETITTDKTITSGEIFSTNNIIESDTSFNLSLQPVFEPITDEIDGLFINELSSTTSKFKDEYGEKTGYVELYNNTNEELLLNSVFLTDTKTNLIRFAIPDSTVIPSYSYKIFYADGESKQGDTHTTFKLSNQSETVILSQKIGNSLNVLDSITYTYIPDDYSFGRYTDGPGNWQLMYLTPGAANNGEIPVNINITRKAEEPAFSMYPNPINEYLMVSVENQGNMLSDYFLDIVDISGKTIYPKILLNAGTSQLNLSMLKNGFYFIRIYQKNMVIETHKIIIYK